MQAYDQFFEVAKKERERKRNMYVFLPIFAWVIWTYINNKDIKVPFVILSSLTRRKHQSRYRHFELIETDRTCGVITSILKTFDQRTCEGIDGILKVLRKKRKKENMSACGSILIIYKQLTRERQKTYIASPSYFEVIDAETTYIFSSLFWKLWKRKNMPLVAISLKSWRQRENNVYLS